MLLCNNGKFRIPFSIMVKWGGPTNHLLVVDMATPIRRQLFEFFATKVKDSKDSKGAVAMAFVADTGRTSLSDVLDTDIELSRWAREYGIPIERDGGTSVSDLYQNTEEDWARLLEDSKIWIAAHT